mmetsp:Transcript_11691/g.18344  ORF Transcript_11691/g.18344 Transcript_11691/m.18344 type:complete len:626 (-) Transcript_11691:686-2563(-)
MCVSTSVPNPRHEVNTAVTSAALQLVLVPIKRRDLRGETLTLPDTSDELIPELARLKRVGLHELPMVEHALRESLSTSLGTEVGVETEGLGHRQISLHVVKRGSGTLVLLEHVATAPVQCRVDTSHSGLRTLDLHQEHGLHKAGLRQHFASIHDTTSGGDDLPSASVDGIGMEGHIEDREADPTHVLLAQNSLLGHPVEAANHGILDLRQILNSLGGINNQVRTSNIGTEAPDLTGDVHIPAVVVSQATATGLDIIARSDVSIVDDVGEILAERTALEVKTVVLVGRLGHALFLGLTLNGLTVGHHRVRDLKWGSVHEILLQVLQADLHMQLSSPSHDVLSRLLDGDDNHRIGLGQTLQALDKLGEVLRVLRLDSATHNRRHRELHVLERIGLVVSGQSTSLDNELVDSNHTASVATRNRLDRVLPPAHEDNNTLDGLHVEVLLLAGDVVRSHDTDLVSGSNSACEDTSESNETTLVGSWNHLGDVKHKRTVGVASLDSVERNIVLGSGVEKLRTVPLGNEGRRQVDDHHLQESLVGREPRLHGTLEERLALELKVLLLHSDVESSEHLLELVSLVVHGGLDDLADRVEHEHIECTVSSVTGLGPLLLSGVEIVLTPEPLAHLVL